MNAPPSLSVVVCSIGAVRPVGTLESIAEAARVAEASVEPILVWQAAAPPPDVAEDVRVLEVFSAGLGLARNRGLGIARAPLVAFVDDDELVDRGWVSGVLRALEHASRPDGVFGAVIPLDDHGLPHCHFEGETYRVFRDPSTPPWVIGTGGNMAFRTKVLLEAGGFDPLFGAGAVSRSAEESELIVRLLGAGRTLAFSPEMVAYHPTTTAKIELAARFPYAFGMGRVVRLHRNPMLGARYLRSISQVLASSARRRDSRRWREGKATLQGFVVGLCDRGRPLSPAAPLRRMPESIAAALEGVEVEPARALIRARRPHFLYRTGDARLLHLYVDPSEELRRGLDARERIRAETGLRGIPELYAIARGTDALWVLEDLLRGTHPRPEDAQRWFPDVAEWAVALGGLGGTPLRETPSWSERAERLELRSPAELRTPVARALEIVGELPARNANGDLQRENILLGGDGGVALIDWEAATRESPPGFDLVSLAVNARGNRPDPSVVVRLAQGSDVEWAPLRLFLERVGVTEDALRPMLLVALASWAAREASPRTTPDFFPSTTGYRDLLDRCAPHLS
jgi:hypothetical protein